MLKTIINTIFPPTCVICGKIGKKWICPKCNLQLKSELKYFKIKKNDEIMFYIGFYEENIRKLLLKLKFQDKSYIYNFFIETIAKNNNFTSYLKEYDIIIPVPMHVTRKKQRGYNQAELIARGISKITQIQYNADCLIKIKNNNKQSILSKEERKKNVKNVYKLTQKQFLKDKKILLVDDIYTTGSTINECIHELKKSKPNKIDVFVIAKVKN